ncbi:hypothetical protein Rleg5DRAFT_6242 [Rhizobium leguminosarum bv. viciae WSM1455]|nr:hypothetical protein Rleg5DRAFT_6242 [Rhizobium leguminosarum bv. viciae WSM1455]
MAYGDKRVAGMKRPLNVMSASVSDPERDFVIAGQVEDITDLRAQIAALQETVAKVVEFLDYTKLRHSRHQMYDKWDIHRFEHLRDELAIISAAKDRGRQVMTKHQPEVLAFQAQLKVTWTASRKTMRQCAKEIGTSHGTFSRLIAGKLPDLNTYFLVCRWLNEQGDPIAALKYMVTEAENALNGGQANG